MCSSDLASKALDAFTSDATTTAKTIESFSSAAETLAYVFGARLALSGAQAATGFALATKASIQQAAALVATTAAQWGTVNAETAAAKQALETAKSRQADALALMERARVEVLSAEQKIAADRMRQTSEINNLKSVQATLAAERSLEGQRLKAQINEQGRALAIARMAMARLDEVAIIKQIQAAEAQLAATTLATSAEIQAAYAIRSAAVAAYGETTLAVNAAVRTSDAATVAASSASKAVLLTAAAGRGLLALLTGPVGLIAATALIATSFFSMRTSADDATKALSAHGAAVDEVVQKYEKLNGAQQRMKRLDWIDEQQEALSSASSALADYAYKLERGINFGSQTKQFRTLIEEVERGQRSLESVTQWVESNVKLSNPAFRREIAELTQEYDNNVQKADELKKVLGSLDGETRKAAQSAEQLRLVQSSAQEQSKAQVAKWDEYIAKLRETRDLFGANKKAQAEFEASKMGLNDKQREEARLVASQIDVMDKYKDAVKDGDKVKQQSLRKELEAIYARQQALADAAAAEKKLQDAANKAAEESANKKITEMQRVLVAANKVFNAAAGFSAKSNFLTGRNILLADPEQQSILGRSMVLTGSSTPATGVVPRKTPQQLAAERLAQIEESTDPNKTAGDKAEKSLKKRFETMEEGYKRQIELMNTSTDKRKNATEVEKLAFEVSSGKLEGVNAQQRKRLEGLATELDALKKLKLAEEDAKKLASFRSSVDESYRTAKSGFDQELVGSGQGDQYRERLKERLAIEEDFNRQQRELVLQRNSGDITQGLFDKETELLSGALAARLELQEDYYSSLDEAQSNWMDGVSDAWQNFADAAQNYSALAADATTSVLGSARSELSTFMSDVATGSKDAGDALMDMVTGFAKSMIGALADMAAQWLVYQAVQLLVGKSTQSMAGMGLVANAQATAFQAQLAAYAATAAIPIVGPAAAPAAAAAAALATAPMVAGVASSALMGMAHDGMDNIPREGTWLLDGGERVLNPNQNRDLTQYLRNAGDGGSGAGRSGGITINAPITVQAQPGMSDEAARRQGAAMEEGFRQMCREVVAEEFGQGGSMWRR